MQYYERTLQGIGKSLLVTLPKSWATAHKLHKGSTIKLCATEEGNLLIAPELSLPQEHRQTSIRYDEHFIRRFFREYFAENERIAITIPRKLSTTERKEFYAFLKKFINVQIVEDTEEQIVVKCFRIDELTVRECLERMHFLCLTMMDELLGEQSRVKLAELEETLTKFYYILVMQIRRFLTEGKYTEQNQLSLIRAMDFRMVAEKIERIADVTKLQRIAGRAEKQILRITQDYYRQAVSSFLNEDFSKALVLWTNERRVEAKIDCLAQGCASRDLRAMLHYARQISTLVR